MKRFDTTEAFVIHQNAEGCILPVNKGPCEDETSHLIYYGLSKSVYKI